VNSHFHPDHTHGNQAFPGQVHIIGTTAARRDVLQKDLPALNRTLSATQEFIEKLRKDAAETPDALSRAQIAAQIRMRQEFLDSMSRLKVLAPIITVDDRLLIREDKRDIELVSLGGGHTDGDLVLYLPSDKIVFAGDLFFNEALPNTQDANILDWIKTLTALIKLDADRFVAGHGSIGTKSDVVAFLKYFEELKGLVEPAVARGDIVEQVIRDIKVPEKYSSYRFQQFFAANIQKMYAELKAQQATVSPDGAPVEGAKKSGAEKP